MKKLSIAFITCFAIFNMTTSFAVPFCTKENLSAIGQFEAAAGNSFGTFTITNISKQTCKIIGDHALTIQYPISISNIKIKVDKSSPNQALFILKPKQSIYAAVHYPNGPQCSSALDHPDVMFSYEVAPKVILTFMNGTSNNPFEITTCRSTKEPTLISLFSFSTHPR